MCTYENTACEQNTITIVISVQHLHDRFSDFLLFVHVFCCIYSVVYDSVVTVQRSVIHVSACLP